MRGQRAAQEADAPPDPDELLKERAPGIAAEGHLVQPVDLALDVLGDLVVAGDDLVHEAREEPGRLQRTKGRLAGQALDEPLEGPQAGHGGRDDDPRAGQEVDLPSHQAEAVVRGPVRGGLQGLKREVECARCDGRGEPARCRPPHAGVRLPSNRCARR